MPDLTNDGALPQPGEGPSPAHGDAAPPARDLAILADVAAALNAQPDLERALQAALEKVAELLGLRTGWVWLLAPEGGASYVAAARHLPPALAHHPERLDGSCYCLDTFREGDLAGAANINVVRCSRLRWLEAGTEGLTHHASIPLYAGGPGHGDGDERSRLGVLNVAAADWRELSSDDLRLLHTIGDLLGIAIQRARLYDRSVALGAAAERNRLAREIHDTLAQSMVGIALQLETAELLLEEGQDKDTTRVRTAIARALGTTREALEAARRSVRDLRATPLESRTLPEALAALANEIEAAYGLPVTTTLQSPPRPLAPQIEHVTYRVAREALTNAARHADAGLARLSLTFAPTQLRLVIEDDGRGFDPLQPPAERFGLKGMRERAVGEGGTLDIRSNPGAGTSLKLALPTFVSTAEAGEEENTS